MPKPRSDEMVETPKGLTLGQRIALIRGKLDEQKEKFESAAVNGVDVDRYTTLLIRSCAANAKVLNASIESLALTLLESVSLGLPIGTALGYGYVVPYKGRAQFQAGYQGLLKLAYNDGRATMAAAEVVRAGDEFGHTLGTRPEVIHRLTKDSDPNGEIQWAYGIIHGNGPPSVAVFTADGLKLHAQKYVRRDDRGQYYSDSLIVTNYEMWARKTMLRRALKFVPMSETARLILQREEYIEEGVDPEPAMADGEEQTTQSLREAAGIEVTA